MDWKLSHGDVLSSLPRAQVSHPIDITPDSAKRAAPQVRGDEKERAEDGRLEKGSVAADGEVA